MHPPQPPPSPNPPRQTYHGPEACFGGLRDRFHAPEHARTSQEHIRNKFTESEILMKFHILGVFFFGQGMHPESPVGPRQLESTSLCDFKRVPKHEKTIKSIQIFSCAKVQVYTIRNTSFGSSAMALHRMRASGFFFARISVLETQLPEVTDIMAIRNTLLSVPLTIFFLKCFSCSFSDELLGISNFEINSQLCV